MEIKFFHAPDEAQLNQNQHDLNPFMEAVGKTCPSANLPVYMKKLLKGDLTIPVKTIMAGKRELKERLKIDLSTVTAKINALPIKKEVGKNRIKALALELTNAEIQIRESETMILQDIEKEIEELKMGMTEEELKMFDSELMQHAVITRSKSKKVVERLEKDILDLENKMAAIPIEN
ncbi:hypothetical protein BdWA1_003355 [Babesia duncani]|uniref:Uncharacterized protein n=1 Tax=Babesia duncani TaxID=323732 RepID=A0AAD9UMS8_9APIC|nr:hypothetical protein BdWA1_003355 [Babesia duncani]